MFVLTPDEVERFHSAVKYVAVGVMKDIADMFLIIAGLTIFLIGMSVLAIWGDNHVVAYVSVAFAVLSYLGAANAWISLDMRYYESNLQIGGR